MMRAMVFSYLSEVYPTVTSAAMVNHILLNHQERSTAAIYEFTHSKSTAAFISILKQLYSVISCGVERSREARVTWPQLSSM